MSLFPYQFPEDLTGVATRNRVVNEVHTFSTHAERIFIPSGGPYFTDSVRIIDDSTGLELQPITQYTCLHMHTEGTLASGAQVCTIIVIKDTSIVSATLSYQAIGGQYGEVVTTIKEIIDNIDWDRLDRVSWASQVYGKPETYPAAVHRHPGGEFGDWKRFHTALNNIYQAIIHKDNGAWQAVYAYIARLMQVMIDNLGINKDDYYTKAEVDALLAACCDGSGGNNGAETFRLTTTREGNELVYSIVSNRPDSTVEAPYTIMESSGIGETFSMSSVRVGNTIVSTVTSSDPTSTASANYVISENNPAGAPPPPTPTPPPYVPPYIPPPPYVPPYVPPTPPPPTGPNKATFSIAINSTSAPASNGNWSVTVSCTMSNPAAGETASGTLMIVYTDENYGTHQSTGGGGGVSLKHGQSATFSGTYYRISPRPNTNGTLTFMVLVPDNNGPIVSVDTRS